MNEDSPRDRPFEPTERWDVSAPDGGAIGPYRLVQKLGEGGMGQVWLAQQNEPIRRAVAVKIIKSGMDTAEVIRRFESERRTLALMDHPCIAKVYDAGTTPRGRPYFAMEYVRGVPIHQYCDSRRLRVRERLELFQSVCDGVQHAHQKAVIHRDLKSSNVLVTEIDGQPTPKIIDFGLAKAMGPRFSEETMVTALGQLVGTPDYMSPEQADFTSENVDTRTDVYALGVILYRLLSSEFPFDPKDLRSSGIESITRIIREQDPPRPSVRVRSLGPDGEERAALRGRTVSKLAKQLEGDLDWIVMKALEKSRDRRYDSPQEFARDIQRHLENRPVVAGPPGKRYRARKFIRRHRTEVSLAAAGLVVLLAFLTMTLVQSARVNRQATYARQVADFMTNLFLEFDPVDRGSTITLREILDEGARRTKEELGDQPLVQARLMSTIGGVYRNLALYDEATPLLRGAVGLLEADGGEQMIGEALVEWAVNERVLGHYDRADSLYRRALPLLESSLGADHPQIAKTLHGMGVLARTEGRNEEAERLYLRALEIQRSRFGDDHPDVAKTLSDLAVADYFQGDLPSAEARTREALEIRERTLPANHANIGESYNNLGAIRRVQGDLPGAVELLQRALEIRIAALGPQHTDVGQTHMNLGAIYRELGEPERAAEHLEAARSICEASLGPEHPLVATALSRLAGVRRELGQLDEALPLARRSLRIREAEGSHPVEEWILLAEIHADRGDLPAADDCYQRALAIQAEAAPEELSSTRERYARMLSRTGREAEADSVLGLDR